MKDERELWFVAKESKLFPYNLLILGRNAVRINKGTCGKHSELSEKRKLSLVI